MSVLLFTILLGVGSLAAGLLGALTGLGGGVVIVPLLVLVFGVDLPDAVGTSLVAVIATSSGAAAAYVREGYSNIRIGMVLEVATTIGAVAGALLALVIAPGTISIIFGVVLLISAYLSARQRPAEARPAQSDRLANYLRLRGSFPTPEGPRHYHVVGVPLGFGLMWVAGVLSGLLGIGSGAFKVLAMDQVMKLPFKVSTTTSNFMIGVTAAASAGVYLNRGTIAPELALPVVLGVLAGSAVGTRILAAARVRVLRIVFAVLVLAIAVEMIYKGICGGL
jgi:hypothetical protein